MACSTADVQCTFSGSPFLVRSEKAEATEVKFGTKQQKYLAIPKKAHTPASLSRGGVLPHGLYLLLLQAVSDAVSQVLHLSQPQMKCLGIGC